MKTGNWLAFDTEDDARELSDAGKSGFLKRVTQIAAITAKGDTFYNLGDVPQFLSWLEKRPERFIYAHNLQYDLGNLFGKELDNLDATLVGSRIIKAVWHNKTFVDSFNLWPMSAKKIGKAFGIEKLETDSMAHDKEYVFQDVRIIHAAIAFVWDFAEKLGLRSVPSTLGGLAVATWKQLGGVNVHGSDELARLGLYGGRVELFKVRNDCDDIAYTDINSLYPAMMLGDFPGQLEPCRDLREFGLATVTIEVPECDIAPLPMRDDKGRILYPWGTLTGTWTVAEIIEAERRGARLQKLHEAIGTSERIRPYASFMLKMYELRLESKSEAEKLFFKLLMNTLYGRLGATGKIGRTVWQTERNRFDGVPFGDKVLVSYEMPLSSETNWSHAAYVTAYGRLALLRYIDAIGASNMIYCDTDSAIFDCPGRKLPFAVSDALGEMKLVSWEKVALTYAPKMYRVGEHFKAKGVPKRKQREFIEQGKAEYDLPYRFREAVAFFDRQNSRRLSVWHRVQKFNRANYDKKRLQGNRYYPCKVNVKS